MGGVDGDVLREARALAATYDPDQLRGITVATLTDDDYHAVLGAEPWKGADGQVVILAKLINRLAEQHDIAPEAVAEDALSVLQQLDDFQGSSAAYHGP